ncbi:unnamed protein product [Camellia sinensis]
MLLEERQPVASTTIQCCRDASTILRNGTHFLRYLWSRITNKMPTDGQTKRGNEMVGHLEDQNEGPNFLNTENGSNEESITTPILHDFVLGC